MKDAKEEEENMDIADMDLTYHNPLHSLNLTFVPNETCRSSKENDIVPTEGEQIIDVSHIDLVPVDQRLKLGYCDLMMQLQHMMYPKVRLCIQTKSGCQLSREAMHQAYFKLEETIKYNFPSCAQNLKLNQWIGSSSEWSLTDANIYRSRGRVLSKPGRMMQGITCGTQVMQI